ncbi:hypothetical protein CRENBAI_007349 [Crenichthys baileyi]|uniref:Uncharacterized protein n=1 Tax=Crenichthys baileyi TaxID=28760 RepID=A0AAV9RGF5_9TELE
MNQSENKCSANQAEGQTLHERGRRVHKYCGSCAHAVCEKKILNGGQSAPYDLFSCSHNALQSLLILSTAVTKPHCDAVCQDSLHRDPGFCGFFTTELLLMVQLRSSEIVRPRNMVVLTLSTSEPFMRRGQYSGSCLPQIEIHLLGFVHIKG